MSTLAIAVLVGRLTRDAELKSTTTGLSVCHFSIATNTRKKQGNEWIEEASFWDIDYWGKAGEAISQYLSKGKLVAVEGSLKQNKWEQDGQTRSKVVITANSVQLLGGSSGTVSTMPAKDTPENYAQKKQSSQEDDFADDIPF